MNLQPNLSIRVKWEVQNLLSVLFKREPLKTTHGEGLGCLLPFQCMKSFVKCNKNELHKIMIQKQKGRHRTPMLSIAMSSRYKNFQMSLSFSILTAQKVMRFCGTRPGPKNRAEEIIIPLCGTRSPLSLKEFSQ